MAGGLYRVDQNVLQTFVPTSNIDLSSITVKIVAAASSSVQLRVYSRAGATPDPNTDTLIGSGSVTVPETLTETDYKISLTTPAAIVTTGVYYMHLSTSNTVYFSASGTNPYASGQVYVWELNFDAYLDYNYHLVSHSSDDLYFKLWSSDGGTVGTYEDDDPTVVVRDVMDDYAAQGGTVTYNTTTTQLTGQSIDYSFSVNTPLEAIEKMHSVATAGWYWFVDCADGLLYFKNASSTADHTFVFKHNVISLEIEETVEQLKNVVYFTGGDTGGGSNLYIKATASDIDSAELIGLSRVVDNRVTVTATGTAIANNIISNFQDVKYIATITVDGSLYDLTTIKLGHMVSIKNTENFISQLLLQVVRIERSGTTATLTLGVLPVKANKIVNNLSKNVYEISTLSNPSVPA